MTNLYASIGEQLVHYEVDVAGAELIRRNAVTLPANVQYVWPHPSGSYLYVATSDRVRGTLGENHDLTIFRIANDGTLHSVNTLPLPYRPIHMTVDATGKWAAATYNYLDSTRGPGTVHVYRIRDEGALLEPMAPHHNLDAGMYPHQARFTREGRHVLVCARGNDATANHPEDPGCLKILPFRDGNLGAPSSFQYPFGLGPRHLDIHPTKPWVYVSMERGNKLCVHFLDERVAAAPGPAFIKSTLADENNDKRVRQLAGTIHVHPAGTHVYLANRADGTVRTEETAVFEGGENNIAVYRIDQESAEPSIIQHVDTRGICPRTFSIERSGGLLVVGNEKTRLALDGGKTVTIPVSLALFRISVDGRLDFVRRYDLEGSRKTLRWMGFV
jgi:6-phosphogluconolactonase